MNEHLGAFLLTIYLDSNIVKKDQLFTIYMRKSSTQPSIGLQLPKDVMDTTSKIIYH